MMFRERNRVCHINMIPTIGAFNSVLHVGDGKMQNHYTPRVDGQEPSGIKTYYVTGIESVIVKMVSDL
jgi:hypothetical protein